MRKVIAALLAALLLAASVPTEVWANTPGRSRPTEHNPFLEQFTVISMAPGDPGAGNQYILQLNWTQPGAVNDFRFQPGAGAPPITPPGYMGAHIEANGAGMTWEATAANWSRYASHYELRVQNMTIPAEPERVFQIHRAELLEAAQAITPGFEFVQGEIPGGTQLQHIQPIPNLTPGSLYHIELIPRQRVPVHRLDTSGDDPVNVWDMVAVDAVPGDAVFAARSMLLLTDIAVVETEGGPGSITFEWQNPTVGAFEFPFWEVTFVEQGGGASFSHIIAATDVEQRPNRLGRQNLRHTISDARFQVGQFYFVQVNPLNAQQQPVLGPPPAGGINELQVPGPAGGMPITYSFAFRGGAVFQSQEPTAIIPELHLMVDGDNFVRLEWSSLVVGAAGAAGLSVHVEQWNAPFQEGIPTGNPARILGMLHMNDALERNWWPVGPVEVMTGFTMSIWFEGSMVVRSNMAIFDPSAADFGPYIPVIQGIDWLSPHGRNNALVLDWQPFFRAPLNDEERAAMAAMIAQRPIVGSTFGERAFLDFDVEYRIYVSDNWASLQWSVNPPFAPTLQVTGRAALETLLYPPTVTPQSEAMRYDLPVFRTQMLTMFYTNVNGVYTQQLIGNNAVYFVRIEAVRGDHVSGPSFESIFIPPYDPQLTRAEMIDAPPLVGSAGFEDEELFIDLAWDLRYLEIGEAPTNVEPEWRWHASVGVDIRGEEDSLIFGRRVQLIPPQYIRRWGFINHMLPDGPLSVRERLRLGQEPLATLADDVRYEMGNWLGYDFDEGHPLRIQDLTPRRYRIHVVTYDELLARFPGVGLAQAFLAYRDWLTYPAQAEQWYSIGLGNHAADGTAGFRIPADADFLDAPLAHNTTYVVFFQPYEPLLSVPGGLAFFPNYIVVTTPDDFVPDRPTPTTPVLFPGQAPTDTTVSVRWRALGLTDVTHNTPPPALWPFGYELRFSESIFDYPGGGELISWEYLLAAWNAPEGPTEDGFERLRLTFWQHPVTGQWYHHLTLPNLFPGTNYYVWARAFSVADEIRSGWSNPVEQRTRDISPPSAPQLGLAGRAQMNAYNQANNTNFAPIEPDAFTLFVQRVFSDFQTHLLPRAADGEAQNGAAALLDMPQLNNIYAVRFSELAVNRLFYARARTHLTISRTAPIRVYSYEIQVADNPDFLDAIIFTVPPLAEFDAVNMRRAVSPWVTMEVATAPDGGDFDGAFRPEQFPLPDYDWEITYVDGTLTWRFRTNRIGADGRPDQQVDQRFISRLVDSRTHRFEVDLTRYATQPDWPVRARELIVPLSIMRAFDERRITLAVRFGDVSVEVPPGAFDTAAVRALGMGAGAYVRISMQVNEAGTGLPLPGMNHHFASLPQRLGVTAVTPARSLALTEFARALNVALHLEDITEPGGTVRTGLFTTTPALGVWQDSAGMHTATRVPATFAGIARAMPQTAPTVPVHDPSRAAMERVSARLTFTDMHEFSPAQVVSATVFNNIMHALATDSRSVQINASLSAAARQRLERARFLAPDPLTFEDAADILVRFYEVRTRRIITPLTAPQMVIGIANATPALQQSLLKAADLGFVTGAIAPRGALTMGEFIGMLDIVITDIGF